MNDIQLCCFIAAADTLNFSKAAEQMYFSKATVTHYIQTLESELGTKLFIRTKKSVSLTEAGRIFCIHARSLLEQERLAVQNVRNMKLEKYLRIGCTSNSEAFRIIPFLKKLRRSCPDVIPEINVKNYSEVVRNLDMESMDVAVGSRAMVKNTALQYTELGSTKLYAAVNAQSPLSVRQSIRFDELEGKPLLTLSPQMIPFDGDNLLESLFAAHAARNNDMVIDLEANAFPFVIAGYGAFIIPGYRIPPHIKELGIIVVPIEEIPNISYGILYKRKEEGQLWQLIVESGREIFETVASEIP